MKKFNRLARLILPVIGVVVGVIVSVGLYIATERTIENSARLQFKYQTINAQLVIEARVADYTDILQGLSALFRVSDSLSRTQFHDYLSGLNLRKFPGIRSINYSQRIPAAEKAAFETSIRQDTSLDAAGYPAFGIHPPSNNETYNVLVYVEPMQGFESVLGLDLSANPRVAQTLGESRDTGKLMASGRLISVGNGKPQGLAMRLPLYRNGMPVTSVGERRAAYIGSVGAGFNIEDILHGVLDANALSHIHFRLYDTGALNEKRESGTTSPERLLYDTKAESAKTTAADAYFTVRVPWEMGGRVWESEFSASKADMLGKFDENLPWLAMLAGLLSSSLLFSILYFFASSRARAVKLAQAMTKDLRESQVSLEDAQHMAHLGNWLLDPDTGTMNWSTETYRILGLTPASGAEMLATFLAKIHAEDRDAISEGFRHAVCAGTEFFVEHRICPEAGTTRWVQTNARLGLEPSTNILRGTIMDITARKLAMQRTEIEHRVTQLASSSSDIETVIPDMIEALCRGFGWACGVYRVLDENSMRLRAVQHWGAQNIEVTTFLAGQRQLQIPIGSGLGGRAWQSQQPIYVKDLRIELGSIVADDNMTELRCGVAFLIRSEERMFGVIECFGTRLGTSEENLPQFLQAISSQISQYLQRKFVEDALRYVAAHDSLTELPNRNMFHQALRHALVRDARYHSGVAVMFIDLDRFKMVNDTVGHSAGDRVLQECAQRLRACLRDSDIVARLSGDEFAVIIERFNEPVDIGTAAKKVLSSLEKPFVFENQEFLLAASIGISTFPLDGSDAETLLKNADAAMYRAKADGNSYQFYSAQMNAHNLARFAMESSLRHAIVRNEFLLHFQPKLDLRTNRVSGVEALLRWQHPEMGLVPPMQFIPLAEETGIIIEIGHWVLKAACAQAREWQRQGLPKLRIAVNLSVRQFNHKQLLHDIATTLAETGLDADLLELEITESMVMDNTEHAMKLLGDLKSMGIHLSIDDFGTGYSSLAYLRKLPVDCVKIDRAFIKDIPTEVDDMAISKSIITLGHSLRLKVIAEGVETQAQLEFLREEGCDEMQGYLYSKPLSVNEASAFLKNATHQFSMLE